MTKGAYACDPIRRLEDPREPLCALLFGLPPFLMVMSLLAWLVSSWPEADKIAARNIAIFFGAVSVVTTPTSLWLLGKLRRRPSPHEKNTE